MHSNVKASLGINKSIVRITHGRKCRSAFNTRYYLFFLVFSRISQNKLKRKITPVCLFLTEAASAIRFVKYIVINNILRYITAGSCNIIVAPSLTDIYFKELINSVTTSYFISKLAYPTYPISSRNDRSFSISGRSYAVRIAA